MKFKIRTAAALVCLILAAAVLPACGGNTAASEGSAVREDTAPETTTVRLALNSGGHILNAIADKQGYLADEGIKVVYVPVDTDADAFRGLADGTIDVASNSGTNLPLQMISEGMDITIFGGYLLTGCMPIFARVETEWNGIESLIGKTVAFEPNLYAITGPLLDMGYDPLHDINWYQPESQEARIKAVENGEADFGLVGTALNYSIDQNPDLKIVTYACDVLPGYSCCRAEARTDWINENPNTVKALLKAWIRAMAYYDTHHDETVAMVSGMTGHSEEYTRAYMDNARCDLNTDPMKKSVVRAWNYMERLGLLDDQAQQIEIEDHINTDIYKAALDECQEQYGSENPKFYEKLQAQYAKNNE